jgi:hypothetical protein
MINVTPEEQEKESQEREYGFEKFKRLTEVLQLQEPDLDKRIDRIKKASDLDLMNLVELGASCLRGQVGGLSHYKEGDEIERTVVVESLVSRSYVSPPKNIQLLREFFQNMKKEINRDNYLNWSSKAYLAIILSHTQPDGNGRIARNLYRLFTKGDIPDEQLERNSGNSEVHMRFINQARINLLKKEMGEKKRFDEYYAFDEPTNSPAVTYSEDQFILYLAAIRTNEKLGLFNKEEDEYPENINLYNLKQEPVWNEMYLTELGKVRTEVFWEAIDLVDEYAPWINKQLDESINKV